MGLTSVLIVPSPKSQSHEVGLSMLSSTKDTVHGADEPVGGLYENKATGGTPGTIVGVGVGVGVGVDV